MTAARSARKTTDRRRVSVLGRLVSSVGLSIGALAIAVLLIELVLRFVAPGENIPQREYDPHLGWRGRPNLECVLNERLFTIAISQNSRGFRDVERSVEKPPGTTRILCCGDSFTWGWGIEQDEIYTTVLEQRYADAGVAVEVLNAGVGGYSTDQLLLYLRDEGFSYSPDFVVYQAAWNDVRDNPRILVEAIYNKPVYDLGDDGELALQGFPVPPLGTAGRLKYFVSRHSRLAYFLRHRLHLARFAQTADEIPVPDPRPAVGRDEVGYPFRLFCRLVAEMDADCRERGAGFVALIGFEVSRAERKYWERVYGHVNVRFVSGYLTARGEAAGTPAYIPRDGHWTEDGHRWVADVLYDDVLRIWNMKRRRPSPAGSTQATGLREPGSSAATRATATTESAETSPTRAIATRASTAPGSSRSTRTDSETRPTTSTRASSTSRTSSSSVSIGTTWRTTSRPTSSGRRATNSPFTRRCAFPRSGPGSPEFVPAVPVSQRALLPA